ncbi:hypothetical protein C8R47DRAFT_1280876 [Mycena vitilis]|nr:hypothetical protein C8R47DRAFT_1280876 [Mycena vitilis]
MSPAHLASIAQLPVNPLRLIHWEIPPATSPRYRSRPTRVTKHAKGASAGTGNGSLEVLTDTTKRAFAALPSRRIELPDGADTTTQQANGRNFGELVERGKSHLSYAIVAILHKSLPVDVLSRGSLTSLGIIKEEINAPPAIRKAKVLEMFFASLGDVSKKSSTEGVQQYLTVALGAVFGAVCDKGRDLEALNSGGSSTNDDTHRVLENVKNNRESTKKYGLKRRYSPGKENALSLSVPDSDAAKPALKRRKSLNDTPRTLRVQRLMRILRLWTRIPFLPFHKTQKNWEQDLGDILPVELVEDVSAECADSTGIQDPHRQRLVQNTQNGIIAACATADYTTEFPALPPAAWGLLLGDAVTRDPLEICGDAGMHVVLTEILLDRLENDPEGMIICKVRCSSSFQVPIMINRRAITAALLTNCSFLHILLRKGYVSPEEAERAPKYAGNAFEIFDAAVIIFVSIESLNTWVKKVFQPLIKAAIQTWRDTRLSPPLTHGTIHSMRDLRDEENQDHRQAKRLKTGSQQQGMQLREKSSLSKVGPTPATDVSSLEAAESQSSRAEAVDKGSLWEFILSILMLVSQLCDSGTAFTFSLPLNPRSTSADTAAVLAPVAGSSRFAFDPFGLFSFLESSRVDA